MASKSMKNLDFNNLHLLNLPSKLFIVLIIIAAMLGLGYIGLFKNQIESLEEYEAKEVELKNTYKQKSIDAAQATGCVWTVLCRNHPLMTVL